MEDKKRFIQNMYFGLARRFRKAGFARSEVIPLSGGMATIFRVSVDSMRA